MFFSVIIPVYNKEKDLQKTLESVCAQTFTDFEVIIVNDGSTDESELIASRFTDERFTLLSKPNEGVSVARNYGVKNASYENIVFLDADDYWHVDHLENLATLFQKYDDVGWFATNYKRKHSHTNLEVMHPSLVRKGNPWIGKIDDYFKYSYVAPLAWTSAVGMKKSFFTNLGGFNPKINFGEDTDLWIRAALKSPLAFSSKATAVHQLDASNRLNHTALASRKYLDLQHYEETAKTQKSLKKYLDLNRFSHALSYKMAGDQKGFLALKSAIDKDSLSKKQQLLLNSPRILLKTFYGIKKFFQYFGIRLSAFK